MRAFLHFEATSLSRHGFPIEVAWVFEDGREESHLIRPAPGWKDWDPDPKAPNAIPRDRLGIEGVPVDIIAGRLVEELGGGDVYSNSPFWDRKWLGLLLRTAGLSRLPFALIDADLGLEELVGAILAPSVPSSSIHRAKRRILADASAWFAGRSLAHRALPDARLERERWLCVSRLAHKFRPAAALR